jgi:NADPH-dependent 2,4-dienoyl-CoA reductase/sulfur reductase-like enzyme
MLLLKSIMLFIAAGLCEIGGGYFIWIWLREGKSACSKNLGYDRLVIGTGAVSVEPAIEGLQLPGVFTLRWMDDSFAMQRYLTENNPKTAIIIGAGYIGMEMADALTYRGLKVTVVEYFDSVLTTVDPEFGHLVQAELEQHGVVVNTGIVVEKIEKNERGLTVSGSKGFSVSADMVLVAVGARPETKLAQAVGIETGLRNAIKVDRRMRTNLPPDFRRSDYGSCVFRGVKTSRCCGCGDL